MPGSFLCNNQHSSDNDCRETIAIRSSRMYVTIFFLFSLGTVRIFLNQGRRDEIRKKLTIFGESMEQQNSNCVL